MAQTFKELCMFMTAHSPHKFVLGQHSKYCIPDVISKAHELLDKSDAGIEAEAGVEDRTTMEDVAVELGI